MFYTPLHDKSEECSLQGDDDNGHLPSEDPEAEFSKSWRGKVPPWARLVILLLLCLFSLAFGAWMGSVYAKPTNAACLAHVQKWSPILAEVDNSYHKVRFNGSLMKSNAFRGPAGPETDAAWESLGVNYRSLRLPSHQAIRSGLKPDQVQINPKHGGGFPTNVEGLHHLHCLNLLRQALYYNIDYYRSEGKGAFVNDDNIVQHHVSHCLDIIRQQLMCTPDTGLLGQVWWDVNEPKAFVDFNTEHKCKNFDAIRQWAEDRQIEATVPFDFLKPPSEGDTIYAELP